MIRCDKSAVQRYRQIWLWLLLWIAFVPSVQAGGDYYDCGGEWYSWL